MFSQDIFRNHHGTRPPRSLTLFPNKYRFPCNSYGQDHHINNNVKIWKPSGTPLSTSVSAWMLHKFWLLFFSLVLRLSAPSASGHSALRGSRAKHSKTLIFPFWNSTALDCWFSKWSRNWMVWSCKLLFSALRGKRQPLGGKILDPSSASAPACTLSIFVASSMDSKS